MTRFVFFFHADGRPGIEATEGLWRWRGRVEEWVSLPGCAIAIDVCGKGAIPDDTYVDADPQVSADVFIQVKIGKIQGLDPTAILPLEV